MYQDFVTTALDFQLKSHEKFLVKFSKIFKKIDAEKNGILNEAQFRDLVINLNVGIAEEQIQEYLHIVDPYNNQSITFSQCCIVLRNELIKNWSFSKPE